MPQPDQFKVNISSMRMLESTLMEQRFQVSLRVMNRGREAVSIDGMSCDIELNGKDFASGVSNEKVSIPAFSEGIVSVNVTSTIFGIIRQLQGMQQNKPKTFHYQISGSPEKNNLETFCFPFVPHSYASLFRQKYKT